MPIKDFDIEKIDQYSVEELQEYIRIAENRVVVKKHIEIKEWHLWCLGLDTVFALIGMVPLSEIFNANHFVGILISFISLLSVSGLIEFLINKIYVFISARFEIEIT